MSESVLITIIIVVGVLLASGGFYIMSKFYGKQ